MPEVNTKKIKQMNVRNYLYIVEKAIGIQEGLQCFAHSSTGKIQFKPGEKLSVEKKQVFIPTFE